MTSGPLPEISLEHETRQPFQALGDNPYRPYARILRTLRQTFPVLPVLGSSLVHLRHSIPPEQERLFLRLSAPSENREIPAPSALLGKGVICFLAALYETLWLAAAKVRWGIKSPRLYSKTYSLLLKTWCPELGGLDKPGDFYFGHFQTLLNQRGLSVLFLGGNGRPDEGAWLSKLRRPLENWALARRMFAQTPARYFPEFLLIPLGAPLRTAFQQLRTAFRLRAYAQTQPEAALAIAAAEAALDVLRPYTTQNVLHYDIARAAVRRWKPSASVHLYEGKPWESLFRLGVKRSGRACRQIGYQHTVLLRHSLEVMEPVRIADEAPAPEIVLCLGSITADLLRPGHEALGTRLVPFGSFRFPALGATEQPPAPQRRTVLVIPEGIPSEAELLFNFALALAPRLPEHRFIFRCHPVLPFDAIRARLQGSPESCANVEISARPSIQEDFSRASAVLYRGSSAVLYAILQGVKPIYLHDPRTADVDPLFMLNGWREKVTDLAGAAGALCAYESMSESKRRLDWEQARLFARRYAEPVTPESMDRFLGAAGLSGDVR